MENVCLKLPVFKFVQLNKKMKKIKMRFVNHKKQIAQNKKLHIEGHTRKYVVTEFAKQIIFG